MKKKIIKKYHINYRRIINNSCTNETNCLYCDTCNVCSNFQTNIVKKLKSDNYENEKK